MTLEHKLKSLIIFCKTKFDEESTPALRIYTENQFKDQSEVIEAFRKSSDEIQGKLKMEDGFIKKHVKRVEKAFNEYLEANKNLATQPFLEEAMNAEPTEYQDDHLNEKPEYEYFKMPEQKPLTYENEKFRTTRVYSPEQLQQMIMTVIKRSYFEARTKNLENNADSMLKRLDELEKWRDEFLKITETRNEHVDDLFNLNDERYKGTKAVIGKHHDEFRNWCTEQDGRLLGHDEALE